MLKNSSLGVLAAMLAACSTPVIHEESPALLTNPGPVTTLELEQTIAAAMDTMKVSLAPDALTTSSHLTIEPGMHRSIDKPPELGRNPGRPDHFQLLLLRHQ